jgi:hypothetical protein
MCPAAKLRGRGPDEGRRGRRRSGRRALPSNGTRRGFPPIQSKGARSPSGLCCGTWHLEALVGGKPIRRRVSPRPASARHPAPDTNAARCVRQPAEPPAGRWPGEDRVSDEPERDAVGDADASGMSIVKTTGSTRSVVTRCAARPPIIGRRSARPRHRVEPRPPPRVAAPIMPRKRIARRRKRQP